MNISRFYIQFLQNDCPEMVDHIIAWHSASVGPKTLTVPSSFFNVLVSEKELEKCPHTVENLLLAQYTTEKSKENCAGPAVAHVLDAPNIIGLTKQPEALTPLEAKLNHLGRSTSLGLNLA